MNPELPAAFQDNASTPKSTSKRYRMWEIPGTVHCSIVGTCLDRRDINALIRKGRLQVRPDTQEYQIHGFFVQQACRPGTLSQLMQKTLDKKYAPQVARVGKLRDPAAQRAYWDDACAKGQVAGAYWALLSHRHVSDDVRNAAYGDVHMLSHFMGGLNRVDAQQLWAAERRVADLEARLNRVRRQAEAAQAERDARIASLEAEVHQMRAVCVRLQPSPAARRDACTITSSKQERRRRQQERRLQAARARVHDQTEEIAALKAQIAKLELLPVCPIPQDGSAARPDDCPLEACRLLYVGGRPSAVPHLKNGAAKRQAELLHHDGGVEHSLQQLEHLVERADLVFCPVDCVSHGACLLARELCKRANKPFVPLRSASLSHFRMALDRVQPTSGGTVACSSP